VTSRLGDLATIIRSKNAGPFWVTIDVFLPDAETFERVRLSALTDPVAVGTLYATPPESVQVFEIAALRAVKVSFPRPLVQGSRGERDMHAGQQYVALVDLEIPDAGPASSGPASSGPASSGPASSGPASSGPASPGPASPGPATSAPA